MFPTPKLLLMLLALQAGGAATLTAQAGADEAEIPAAPGRISLAGPRAGVTVVLGEGADKLREEYGVSPVLAQFGWQLESRFFDTDAGLGGVSEWVLLVGGLNQGKVIPSVTWLVGLRTARGLEVGIGPNATPVGVGLALASGVTFRSGSISFPVNLAVVSTDSGVRLSTLVGFNTRR